MREIIVEICFYANVVFLRENQQEANMLYPCLGEQLHGLAGCDVTGRVSSHINIPSVFVFSIFYVYCKIQTSRLPSKQYLISTSEYTVFLTVKTNNKIYIVFASKLYS